MPCIAVATISSDTPIRPSVFSPESQERENIYMTFTIKDIWKLNCVMIWEGSLRINLQKFETCSATPLQVVQSLSVFLKSRLTQKSTKGDGRWQRSKVDEDDGSHALGVQSISKITKVLRVASSHVFDQTSEKTAWTPQGLITRFGGNKGIWKIRMELFSCLVIKLSSQHYTWHQNINIKILHAVPRSYLKNMTETFTVLLIYLANKW